MQNFTDLTKSEVLKFIADFLKNQGVDDEFIERVKMLVSRHEEGGNEDQNLLKDADSISWLETYVPIFLGKILQTRGKEKVGQKFDWMFNRIIFQKARQIAQPMYEKAVNDLNAIEIIES